MDRIAVIILSYKNYQDTLNCVASVQNSSYSAVDIFVIDNHSPDGSYPKLQAELSATAHIYLSETGMNLGYAGGMNDGAQKAQQHGGYAYYLFLNNDTLLEKDCLSALVNQAREQGDQNVYAPISYFIHTNIVFCGGMVSYIPGLFQFKYLGWPVMPHQRPYRSPYLSGACFLVSARLFERIGGFDEALYLYGEDVLFGEEARRLGGSVYMVPAACFWHSGSKAGGYVSVTKAYYLSRNLPRLVKMLSNNNPVYRLRMYFYLFTKSLLALLYFNRPAVWAIFRGLRDYRAGVGGPMVQDRRWQAGD